MKRQNRRGKRPTERGNAVFVSDSGGPSSQARIPIARSFFSFCVLRYLPTRGHGVAALFFLVCVVACARRFPEIPELNTCAGDELHAYSEAYDRIGSQKQLREANIGCTTEIVVGAGTLWHILYQKRFFWLILAAVWIGMLALWTALKWEISLIDWSRLGAICWVLQLMMMFHNSF